MCVDNSVSGCRFLASDCGKMGVQLASCAANRAGKSGEAVNAHFATDGQILHQLMVYPSISLLSS